MLLNATSLQRLCIHRRNTGIGTCTNYFETTHSGLVLIYGDGLAAVICPIRGVYLPGACPERVIADVGEGSVAGVTPVEMTLFAASFGDNCGQSSRKSSNIARILQESLRESAGSTRIKRSPNDNYAHVHAVKCSRGKPEQCVKAKLTPP
ncbi:hypothetical protein BC629DRAFT_1440767 [Irpex lacteus]|nr:hypothetical protein BC629DRAFT_1440767 [Irpex lacteus]